MSVISASVDVDALAMVKLTAAIPKRSSAAINKLITLVFNFTFKHLLYISIKEYTKFFSKNQGVFENCNYFDIFLFVIFPAHNPNKCDKL